MLVAWSFEEKKYVKNLKNIIQSLQNAVSRHYKERKCEGLPFGIFSFQTLNFYVHPMTAHICLL